MARQEQHSEPQVILITGASSGLGAALAEAYAMPAATLLLCGRDGERLAQVATLCRDKGAQVELGVFDIRDQQAVQLWITAMDQKTPVDLVIANAGISAGTGGDGEALEQVERIFAVNIQGVLNTIYPLIYQMESRGSGHIALMSSLAGFRGLPGSPAYSASKAAVRVYGEALRGYVQKKGITVSVICPGYVKTPMTDINPFPMPFLMPVDKAARYIKKRLFKRAARIAFPWPMYFVVWLMMVLPPWMTDPLFARLPEKPSV